MATAKVGTLQAQIWEQSRRQAAPLAPASPRLAAQPDAQASAEGRLMTVAPPLPVPSGAHETAAAFSPFASSPALTAFGMDENAWSQIEQQLDSLEEALNASTSRRAAAAMQGHSAPDSRAQLPASSGISPSPDQATSQRSQDTLSSDLLTPEDSLSQAASLDSFPASAAGSSGQAMTQLPELPGRHFDDGIDELASAVSLPAGINTVRMAHPHLAKAPEPSPTDAPEHQGHGRQFAVSDSASGEAAWTCPS